MKNAAKLFMASLAFGAVLACGGGGGGPTPNTNATKLAYTNPAQDGYWLEATGGNNTGTITLALRGPSSVSARGVNFGLGVDQSKVRFVQQEGSDYATPGNVLELGAAPRIFRAVLDGENVRVSMAQKGAAVPARSLDGPIASVQARIQSGTQKGAVRLTALPAKVLLADGTEQAVQVSVGTLEAQ